MSEYYKKYMKYKHKFLNLKTKINQKGGSITLDEIFNLILELMKTKIEMSKNNLEQIRLLCCCILSAYKFFVSNVILILSIAISIKNRPVLLVDGENVYVGIKSQPEFRVRSLKILEEILNIIKCTPFFSIILSKTIFSGLENDKNNYHFEVMTRKLINPINPDEISSFEFIEKYLDEQKKRIDNKQLIFTDYVYAGKGESDDIVLLTLYSVLSKLNKSNENIFIVSNDNFKNFVSDVTIKKMKLNVPYSKQERKPPEIIDLEIAGLCVNVLDPLEPSSIVCVSASSYKTSCGYNSSLYSFKNNLSEFNKDDLSEFISFLNSLKNPEELKYSINNIHRFPPDLNEILTPDKSGFNPEFKNQIETKYINSFPGYYSKLSNKIFFIFTSNKTKESYIYNTKSNFISGSEYKYHSTQLTKMINCNDFQYVVYYKDSKSPNVLDLIFYVRDILYFPKWNFKIPVKELPIDPDNPLPTISDLMTL